VNGPLRSVASFGPFLYIYTERTPESVHPFKKPVPRGRQVTNPSCTSSSTRRWSPVLRPFHIESPFLATLSAALSVLQNVMKKPYRRLGPDPSELSPRGRSGGFLLVGAFGCELQAFPLSPSSRQIHMLANTVRSSFADPLVTLRRLELHFLCPFAYPLWCNLGVLPHSWCRPMEIGHALPARSRRPSRERTFSVLLRP